METSSKWPGLEYSLTSVGEEESDEPDPVINEIRVEVRSEPKENRIHFIRADSLEEEHWPIGEQASDPDLVWLKERLEAQSVDLKPDQNRENHVRNLLLRQFSKFKLVKEQILFVDQNE